MKKDIRRYPFSLWQKIQERYYRRVPDCGAVLMFHDVYKMDAEPAEPSIAIAKENFEFLIKKLLKEKRIVSLKNYDDVLKMRSGDVAITFDDMFKSAYDNALPFLREHKIPFTIFIATGLVDKPGFITSMEVERLKDDALCTIAAHSIHHKPFRFHPLEVKHEACISAKELCANLFAYPYGSVFAVSRRNQKTIGEIPEISCAFSTIDANLTERNKRNRYFLPRRNINDTTMYSAV